MRVDPMPSAAELASFYDDEYYGLQKAKFMGLIELLRGVCLNRRANRFCGSSVVSQRHLIQLRTIRISGGPLYDSSSKPSRYGYCYANPHIVIIDIDGDRVIHRDVAQITRLRR
jgi:hypothetical protein